MIEPEALRDLDLATLIDFFRRGGEDKDPIKDIYTIALQWLQKRDLAKLKRFGPAIGAGVRAELRKSGAERDLNRLIAAGILEETILVSFLLFNLLPGLDRELRGMFGSVSERKKKAKTLLEAAGILDKFAAGIPAAAESKSDTIADDYSASPPQQTADSLHLHANLLFIREKILNVLDANSGQEIARYTLAGAVHRITGKYHDPEVSGIMGVLLQRNDYDENMHRVWRIRTMRRLNPTCSILPALLHAFNTALTEQQRNGPDAATK